MGVQANKPTAVVQANKPTATQPEQVEQPFVFDAVKLKSKLDNMVEHLNGFVGKKGHNPFLYISKNIQPLLTRFQTGENTKELSDAINALPDKPVPSYGETEVFKPEVAK